MTAPPGACSHTVARERALAALRVTAAICTHNRPGVLPRALRSLVHQEHPPLEILVVDNAPPDDAVSKLVEREFPSVRYVIEPVQGLDFARNRALHEATGDVVAFLDDDAVAEPGWVAATERAFAASPALGACTGRVTALGSGSEGERLFEANGGFARGKATIRLPHDAQARVVWRYAPMIAWSISVGSGCSMAVRREAVLQLGGFDEALDLGAALPGGGDLDIFWRLLGAGYEVLYDPAVRARHEHRADRDSAARQIVGHNRALIAWLTKCVVRARGRKRLGIAAFLLWRLAKPGYRLARRVVGRDPLPAPVLLQLWAHGWAGLAAYPRARRLARQRRREVAITPMADPPGGL
jgi:GT2 family glycosyltransferase